jgi:hypothetical protein
MPDDARPRLRDRLIWSGMAPAGLARLLAGRLRRIAPDRLAQALLLAPTAAGVGMLNAVQRLIHGRAIARTALTAPPVVIIGHHRSGTTHLHKLLSLLPDLHAPTSYECFAPGHFLVTGGVLPRLLRPLIAATRPMDAMPNDLSQPQEDDFALLSMGAPTPYRALAFPERAWRPPLEGDLTGPAIMDAQEAFLKALTLRHGKRIVLKSPFHTARLRALGARYPGAVFVHMVRDLDQVGPSTLNFWRRLESGQRLGPPAPADDGRSGFALGVFDWMYERFFADLAQAPPPSLITIHYDDLIADPRAALRRIAALLGPGGGALDLSRVDRHLDQVATYRPNSFAPQTDIYAGSAIAAAYRARYLDRPTP